MANVTSGSYVFDKNLGIDEIIVCSGYRGKKIEDFLERKKNFGCKIIYSNEKTPLGTAGAIKNAMKYVSDESFVVINGDIITNIDLRKISSKEKNILHIFA